MYTLLGFCGICCASANIVISSAVYVSRIGMHTADAGWWHGAQAAGAIHTDFERGFICAEVMAYDVLHELKTESDVKAAGKYRQEGKNYVVQVSLPSLVSCCLAAAMLVCNVRCVSLLRMSIQIKFTAELLRMR